MTVKDGDLNTEGKRRLTIAEAAIYLGLDQRTVTDRLEAGEYDDIVERDGLHTFFRRDALRRWISGEAS